MIKNPPVNAGDPRDTGLIPGLGRSPREGNGNPLQYSCLGNPMDRGAWRATVHGVAKDLDTTAHTQYRYASLIFNTDLRLRRIQAQLAELSGDTHPSSHPLEILNLHVNPRKS